VRIDVLRLVLPKVRSLGVFKRLPARVNSLGEFFSRIMCTSGTCTMDC